MPRFKNELSDDLIRSNYGLVFLGEVLHYLCFYVQICKLSCIKTMNKILTTDNIRAYLRLLFFGEKSFESIDYFIDDHYFSKSIDLKYIFSKEILRQRLEELSVTELELRLKSFNCKLLKRFGEFDTAIGTNMIPVDFDVTPMDYSKSLKEGVSNTYKQVMVYAPIMTYIGGTGYMFNNPFREGKAYSDCEGTRESLTLALSITLGTLLTRFDSGIISAENIAELSRNENVNYQIKHNSRREDQSQYMPYTKGMASLKETPHPGKALYYGNRKISLLLKLDNRQIIDVKTRQVLHFIEPNFDTSGHGLLMVDMEIDAWFTDLSNNYSEQYMMALYACHHTSEHFHIEFKTDMDIKHFPSGKYNTNILVMALDMLVNNLLRINGQLSHGFR